MSIEFKYIGITVITGSETIDRQIRKTVCVSDHRTFLMCQFLTLTEKNLQFHHIRFILISNVIPLYMLNPHQLLKKKMNTITI